MAFKKHVVDDLVMLVNLSESGITENLKKRHANDLIYTNIGPVLVAVNPYKFIDQFGEEVIEAYCGRYVFEMPPHIFAVAESSYRTMVTEHENQCIIISGESGAGKTEASKHIMKYIAGVAGSESSKVQRIKDMILQSNPLLEAFGNAKTLRNNNSSRFGKYMELQFNYSGEPIGARITNYLLEKSRVVQQTQGERNFHIFYQLTRGASEEDRQAFQIFGPESYAILLGELDVDGIDDAKEFEETVNAMNIIGITREEQKEIFATLMGILWLGNIVFEDRDGRAAITDQNTLGMAAYLLGVEGSVLEKALCYRFIEMGQGMVQESYDVPQNVEQAQFARDALGKNIYSRMFDWLVVKLNRCMFNSQGEYIVGVLDIYGFEILHRNSFEQFCINFVNEKLQQIFIERTLKSEQEEYLREGIKWENIKYFNNKIVCDLIEKKGGMLSILDDTTIFPKGDDAKYLQGLNDGCRTHAHYQPLGCGFVVKHYAGDVEYVADGFVEKNKDTLFRDFLELMGASQSAFLKGLFTTEEDLTFLQSKKRPTTASFKFKNQVASLMAALSQCTPHYVRCIKSNNQKKANLFEDPSVAHQVRYLGLLENVRVRRAGYAYRQTFDKFLDRYQMLSKQTYRCWRGDALQGSLTILHDVALVQGEHFRVGHTKIFVRQPETLFQLEEMRDRFFHDHACTIQRAYRRYQSRRKQLELRQRALNVLQGRKERRRASINREYYGDYFNFNFNGEMKKVLRHFGDKGIVFSDYVEMIDRRNQRRECIFVICNRALYVLQKKEAPKQEKKRGWSRFFFKKEKKVVIDPALANLPYIVNARFTWQEISSLTTSTLADGFFIIQGSDGFSTFVNSWKKTEIFGVINEQMSNVGLGQLNLHFTNQASYSWAPEDEKKPKSDVREVIWTKDEQADRVMLDAKEKSKQLTVRVASGLPPNTTPKIREPVTSAPRPAKAAAEGVRWGGGFDVSDRGFGVAKKSPAAPPKPPSAAPSTPSKPSCKALFDFTGQDSNFLSVKAGDVITILAKDESGWWMGERNGVKGYFPSNYTQEIVEPPKPAMLPPPPVQAAPSPAAPSPAAPSAAASKPAPFNPMVAAMAAKPKPFAGGATADAAKPAPFKPPAPSADAAKPAPFKPPAPSAGAAKPAPFMPPAAAAKPTPFMPPAAAAKPAPFAKATSKPPAFNPMAARDAAVASVANRPATEQPPKKPMGSGGGGGVAAMAAALAGKAGPFSGIRPGGGGIGGGGGGGGGGEPVAPGESPAAPVPSMAAKPAPIPPRPAAPQRPQQVRAKALWTFEATQNGDLAFKEGDVIIVVKQDASGWWVGEKDGKQGNFPGNYVELL